MGGVGGNLEAGRVGAEVTPTPRGVSKGDGVSAALEAEDGVVQTRVEAPQRRYPLSVALLIWAETQKIVASDGGTSIEFGTTVAVSADTALVGVPYASSTDDYCCGVVYLFSRNAGVWPQTETRKLWPSVDAARRFGISVALSGDTAVVGASDDDDGGSSAGSAYVFVRNAGVWPQTETQKLKASDAAAGDRLGISVAVDGDIAVVGASDDDDGGASSGSAYVFVRSAGLWPQTETQKLLASDGAAGDGFGYALGVSGETAVVGAYGDDDSGLDSGSAYVFVRSAGIWPQTETQKLLASDGTTGDGLGYAAAVSGDSVLLGAPWMAGGASNNAGAAYLFVRNAASWPQWETRKLLASDGSVDDEFGSAVAIGADAALVGALGNSASGVTSGAAYTFLRDAGAWPASETQKLVASDGAARDNLGWAVAMHGDVAMVGAPYVDGSNTDSGAAYLWSLKLANGEACAAAAACLSGHCAHGYCCDTACDDACGTCDIPELEGICSPLAKGMTPVGACSAYLCDGELVSCPKNCSGDGDCALEHHCERDVLCVPKSSNGGACRGDSACLSGHCVQGICCNEACDGGCGTCAALDARGSCEPLQSGHPGSESCGVYLCTGKNTSCSSECADSSGCAAAHYCVGGGCQEQESPGAACLEHESCASGHCTDGKCCVAESCGAYRCGDLGACELSCSSSAQCASGYQCTSAGDCELLLADSGAQASESGGCAFGVQWPPSSAAPSWYWLLGLLVAPGTRRRRATKGMWRGLSGRASRRSDTFER